ncbi:2TM domain-containing protein [Winogradskyella aquimaris]|uniref:2TM domain-containing protein n=1 Tax=Winogradskyella aquimaris TaxID=864074 RepID=A0ABU5EPB3_9FLAO|nr:2TM domain-containing protein [Winogradskyella aquimaris]MDY2588118.1 2TM domain-containing protein [Winogradskyella aquimaris]
MNDQNLNYIRAKRRVEKEKGFYTHLIIYLMVNTILTFIKVWGDFNSWDSFVNEFLSIDVLSSWTIWGVFLILHFISFKYGTQWEERKIQEYMNEELFDDSK